MFYDHKLAIAVAVSARELSDGSKQQIKDLLQEVFKGTKIAEVEYQIDPKVIGGVCLFTPNNDIDLTVRSQLNSMNDTKVNSGS